MSQYGSLGFALHGWGYRQILSHYYAGTNLSQTNPARAITVLLKDGSAAFSGATRAGGQRLKATVTYTARPSANGELTLVAGKQKIGPLPAPLSVTGPGPLSVAGLGAYRGALVLRPDGGGRVQTVNALDLEDYVRGVVSVEMPSSWPAAALEAQSVAARTYAITSGAAGADFDVYSDTRSQMYRGIAAETASTDAAIAATRGQIVTYAGAPAVTYFFASSGGHTESIQNVWSGVTPEAWLTGVADPYDSAGGNPYYRWKETLTLKAAARRLGRLLHGSLRGIVVTRHGVSPRVITAQVVGTKGRSTVSGSELAQLFGLMSTYMSFTTITSHSVNQPAVTVGQPPAAPAPATGGATLAHGALRRMIPSPILGGTVFPSRRGVRVTVERRDRAGHYRPVAHVRTGAGGRYRYVTDVAGMYRVAYDGVAGPAVTVQR
jgi:stage II sporulation protein D